MNEASTWLLRLAQKNAHIYETHLPVRAIMVTGSVACGFADHYSDIDMLIYYDHLPSEQDLQATRERIGASRAGLYGHDADGLAEYFYVYGVRCDVGHSTTQAWGQIITSVVEEYDTDPIKQKMLSGLLDAIPLCGHTFIQQWKDQAQAYPDQLARAIVQQHLRFPPPSVIEKRIAERDGLLFVHELLVGIEKSLLGILFGLNRMYDPGDWKRMDWRIGNLTIAPKQFSSRLKHILLSEPTSALQQCTQLIEETLDLLAIHMPEVDTTAAREGFIQQSEIWTPVPDPLI